ncbi:hypothetical protein ACF0H5_007902 [Mactra antiquata]
MFGIYLLVVLASVFILGCNGATYGQACDDNSNCTDSYQVCSTTCVCDNGYTWGGISCYAGLGYTCTSDVECKDVNAVCTGGLCTCDTRTHYDSNGATALGTCETRGGPASICPDPITVSDSCIDNAECVDNGDSFICLCSPGYTTSGGQCVQNDIVYGGNCIQGAVPCAGDNTACIGGTCQCSSGYYRHNDECVIMVTTGNTCPSTFSGSSEPCVDNNAVCTGTSGSYTCQCTANYYNNGGTCILNDRNL